MQIDSDDYHDYVFRGGRLVDGFEQMYQKVKNIPWHQDQVAGEPDVRLMLALLQGHAPYPTILDVGCGLGYFAAEFARLGERVYRVDVSPTAIRGLKATFPHIEARVVDITGPMPTPLFPNAGRFDLVVCRGLFWYVFPRIGQVARNVASWVTAGGRLVLHQNFPPLDSHFVGKEILPTPSRLLEHFLALGGFDVVYQNQFHDLSKWRENDDWSTFVLLRTAGAE